MKFELIYCDTRLEAVKEADRLRAELAGGKCPWMTINGIDWDITGVGGIVDAGPGRSIGIDVDAFTRWAVLVRLDNPRPHITPGWNVNLPMQCAE